MDYVRLERAIVDFARILPQEPQWTAISSVEGVFLRQYPNHLEGEHIAALTHSNMMQGRHLLHELDNGTFRYSINIGTEGITFILLMGDSHLLTLNYTEVNSMDAIMTSAVSNLPVLLQALKDL
ncbi:MAG: hypothetical protein ABI947_05700 [Chloroflexota bacterium]